MNVFGALRATLVPAAKVQFFFFFFPNPHDVARSQLEHFCDFTQHGNKKKKMLGNINTRFEKELYLL